MVPAQLKQQQRYYNYKVIREFDVNEKYKDLIEIYWRLHGIKFFNIIIWYKILYMETILNAYNI